LGFKQKTKPVEAKKQQPVAATKATDTEDYTTQNELTALFKNYTLS